MKLNEITNGKFNILIVLIGKIPIFFAFEGVQWQPWIIIEKINDNSNGKFKNDCLIREIPNNFPQFLRFSAIY